MTDTIRQNAAPCALHGASTGIPRLARDGRRAGIAFVRILLLALLASAGNVSAATGASPTAAPVNPDGGIVPLVFESRAQSNASGSGLSIDTDFVHAHTFRLTEPTHVTEIGAYIQSYQQELVYAALYRLDTPDSWPDVANESNLLGTTLLQAGIPPGPPTTAGGYLSLTLQPGWYAIGVGTGRHGATAADGVVSLIDTDTPTTPNSRGPYSVDTTTNGVVQQGGTVRFYVRGETLATPPPSPTDFLMESARPWAWWDFSSHIITDQVHFGTRFEVAKTARVDRVSVWMEHGSGQVFAAIVRLPSADAVPLPYDHPDFADSLVGTTLIDIGGPARDYAGDFGGLELGPGQYALLFGSGHFGAAGGGDILRVSDGIVIPGPLAWGGSFWGVLDDQPAYRMSLSGIVPELSITPDPVAFGTAPAGVTQERTVTITNTGDDDLHLTGIGIINIGFGAFSLGDGTLTCFPSIAAGEQCNFTVLFNTPLIGTFTSGIRVTSDGVPSPYDILLVGTTVPARTVTPDAGPGGTIDPSTPQIVADGATTSFTLTADAHHHIDGVGGTCGGNLAGNVYTTAPVIADCTVVANFVIDTFTVTPGAGGHGAIDPATPQTIEYGSSASFTLTPETGYHVDTVEGSCGGNLAGNVYTTASITADCNVVASFAIDTFTVTPSAGEHGAIDPSTPQTIEYGASASFTLTPETGYHIDGVGGSCGGNLAGNVYTTAPVTADCTVVASFAIDTFTVTPSAGEHGSIAPATPQTVDYNVTTSFTLTPDTGYHIDTVEGSCGGTLAGDVYTTAPVTADCTVVASFAIDPADTIVVVSGSAQSATVTAMFDEPLVVRATNADGVGVPDVTVTFSAPASGASADVPASVVTDASGEASVIAQANEVAGTYTVDANIDGAAAPATFELTNLAGPADRILAIEGGNQATMVGTDFPVDLVALVTDAHDNPVADSTVSFSAPGAGAGAILSATVVTTDAQGHASVTATANDVVGSYFVDAMLDGVDPVAHFALENLVPDLVFDIDIDDGREHAAYGQELEYVVTLGNAGSDAATGVDVLVELPEQLDAAIAVWACLDEASGCTLEGTGDLVDSGVLIPASGSVRYLIQVPVRSDAQGEDVLVNATAITDHAGPVSAADLDQLVVFRDGFDVVGDGDE